MFYRVDGVIMKHAEVAENVKRLVENPPSQDEFIYELLLAKEPGEVLWKNKVWFKNVAQASRLPDVPQVIVPNRSNLCLPNSAEPSDNEQAGRSLYFEGAGERGFAKRGNFRINGI